MSNVVRTMVSKLDELTSEKNSKPLRTSWQRSMVVVIVSSQANIISLLVGWLIVLEVEAMLEARSSYLAFA